MKLIISLVFTTFLFSSTSLGEVDFKFNGGVEYRYQYTYYIYAGEKDRENKVNYMHKYGWNFGMKTTINEYLYLGMKIMNPAGINLDNIKNLPRVSSFNEVLSIPNFYLHFQVQGFFLEFLE